MRVVVYSDEDLEPITILKLPITAREIEERGRRWRVPVPQDFAVGWRAPAEAEMMQPVRVLGLFFEPLVRNTYDGRQQKTWMCLTKADELAMLLNPDWLPGQRRAVEYLQTQNDRLTNMLMSTLLGR